jgi:5-methylcytosine-specific restriction endonuclease McrA
VSTVAPTRFCPVPLCPNKTDGGRCAEHALAKEHARYNWEWRRLYRRKRWKFTRQYVLNDEPNCTDCTAQGRVRPSNEVHHKKRPTTEEEFFDRENLTALCKPCHAARTARGE